jgi:hypothetical protein
MTGWFRWLLNKSIVRLIKYESAVKMRGSLPAGVAGQWGMRLTKGLF